MTTVSWFSLLFGWVDKAPPLAESLKIMTVSGFERVRGTSHLPEKLKVATIARFEKARS